MAGANAHQNVSDQVYEVLLNKKKTERARINLNFILSKYVVGDARGVRLNVTEELSKWKLKNN